MRNILKKNIHLYNPKVILSVCLNPRESKPKAKISKIAQNASIDIALRLKKTYNTIPFVMGVLHYIDLTIHPIDPFLK